MDSNMTRGLSHEEDAVVAVAARGAAGGQQRQRDGVQTMDGRGVGTYICM